MYDSISCHFVFHEQFDTVNFYLTIIVSFEKHVMTSNVGYFNLIVNNSRAHDLKEDIFDSKSNLSFSNIGVFNFFKVFFNVIIIACFLLK